MKEKIVVDKVYEKASNASLPTLLKFQNGSVSALSKENTKFCYVTDTQTKRKGALVIASGHAYHGDVGCGGEYKSQAEQLTDNYLCIRNKVTNKMRIIPLEKALLNNYIYAKLQPKVEEMSKEATAKVLLKQFGGRKASRYVTTKEQMDLDIDVVKNELETTVNESTIAENDEKVNTEKYFESIRPPCNNEATMLEEIFDLADVVPPQLLERLDEEAQALYATDMDSIPIASEYLRARVEKLRENSTRSAESVRNMKLIVYMDCLHNLITHRRVKNLAKAELSRITTKVENDVRERFSDPNGSGNFCRTLYSTEKALCHFIVLALIISGNYEVNIKTLCKELNLPRKKIMQYAKIVHAFPKSSTSELLSFRLPNKTKDRQR